MNLMFSNFLYLRISYFSNIFLCYPAFWKDLKEFKVHNFNFKQASLFFSEKWSGRSLNAFLTRNMNYFGVEYVIDSFLWKERLNFQKIEPNFHYEEAFSRYRYANIPYFLTFFQCFACNWPTRCEPIFSKFMWEVFLHDF